MTTTVQFSGANTASEEMLKKKNHAVATETEDAVPELLGKC